MTVDALCNYIWKDPGFQHRYLRVQIEGASRLLRHAVQKPAADVGTQHWNHLLRCASILLRSDVEEFYDAGLRIVHTALQFGESEQTRLFSGALLALAANEPALRLAADRDLLPPDLLSRLPTQLELEVLAERLAATVNYESVRSFLGNRFQQRLWAALETADWISASAPTSVGKSFLLEKWIERTISTESSATIFYLVPTRALIGQVETNLRAMLRDVPAADLTITSLPLHFSSHKRFQIFIYTQERYHLYLLNQVEFPDARLIIIDEAHKIGGGRRGILLQQVLELSTKRFPSAKYLFASPSTANPESLLEFRPSDRVAETVSVQTPTVNQNLFWVTQHSGRPKDWSVEVLIDGKPHHVGDLVLENRPSISQKLAFISYRIGGDGPGNVIYVNRASDAEDAAELLSQHFEEIDDQELNALSELCEKAVHPQFRLRRFVKKGVAFHYGNIPQLIRSEVERLFTKGTIKYLVCTSTLIEGMNLACRNVFMRNPKRGIRDLMSPDDFWNLAGRAGRWGKEFQGNIYCIDPLKADEWVGGRAPSRKTRHRIEIATSRAISDYDGFMAYALLGATELGVADRMHEQLLSYLVFRKSMFGDLGELFAGGSLAPEQLVELDSAVAKVISDIEVPIEIVQRNPGINPYGINALYKYFWERDIERVRELVPPDPLSDDAADGFLKIFSRITTHLGSSRLGKGKTAFGAALLVANWMKGLPLARIIDGQIKYEEERARRGGSPARNRPAIIRSTMERVETIARFEAPKYLHCYIDILNHYLEKINRPDLIKDVKDIWVFLEFGVSKRTELSLMSLGLSRSSTMAVSEHIKEDSLDEGGVYRWLVQNAWREFGLAKLVEAEIELVLRERSSEFAEQSGGVTEA